MNFFLVPPPWSLSPLSLLPQILVGLVKQHSCPGRGRRRYALIFVVLLHTSAVDDILRLDELDYLEFA